MRGQEISIVVLKPFNKTHANHTKEYMVIVDPAEYKKYKAGDHSIPLVQIVDAMQLFVSETGSQGQWRTPSAGEIASDFDSFNADGSVKEGVYDATKRADDDSAVGDAEEGKGRKAKKVAIETAILITLERGNLQTSKPIGTGGFDMQTSKGSGFTTGNISTSGR